MADFMAVTASSDPKIKDHQAVEKIVSRYYVDPDFNIGVGFDHESGEPYLFVYGYLWPEAWRLPADVSRDQFDPYTGDTYEEGDDGFIDFLKEIAPHLQEPLTVQAVGNTKCCFPLSACQWHIEPDGKEVEISEFRGQSIVQMAEGEVP